VSVINDPKAELSRKIERSAFLWCKGLHLDHSPQFNANDEK